MASRDCMRYLSGTFVRIEKTNIAISVRVNKHIHVQQQGVTTHRCLNFNCSLIKLLFNL